MKRIFCIPAKTIILAIATLFLFSCGGTKTNESVFPNQAAQACINQAIKNKFIVGWEDGTYSIEHASSEESFRKNFVSKNLDRIRHIDRDIKIQLRQLDSSSDVQTQDNMQWQVDQVSARSVWNQGYMGQNIIVGVVDGMVDTAQVQLKNNIAYFTQFHNQVTDSNLNHL